MFEHHDNAHKDYSQLWLATALTLVALTAGNEAIPLVFGTGERATWDWGFLYVTLKFIALPILSGILVVTVVAFAVARKGRVQVGAVLVGVLAVGYLFALYFWPLPWLP